MILDRRGRTIARGQRVLFNPGAEYETASPAPHWARVTSLGTGVVLLDPEDWWTDRRSGRRARRIRVTCARLGRYAWKARRPEPRRFGGEWIEVVGSR
jgi:hypothetical protein